MQDNEYKNAARSGRDMMKKSDENLEKDSEI